MSKRRRKGDLDIVDGDARLSKVSEKMKTKLRTYDKDVCTLSAWFALVVDPLLVNDILQDRNLLREVAHNIENRLHYLN